MVHSENDSDRIMDNYDEGMSNARGDIEAKRNKKKDENASLRRVDEFG